MDAFGVRMIGGLIGVSEIIVKDFANGLDGLHHQQLEVGV